MYNQLKEILKIQTKMNITIYYYIIYFIQNLYEKDQSLLALSLLPRCPRRITSFCYFKHFSKYVLPIIPPRIAFNTFISNNLLLFCKTSAASLFRGSSGLGSYKIDYVCEHYKYTPI